MAAPGLEDEAGATLESDGRRPTFHQMISTALGPAGPFLPALDLDRAGLLRGATVRLRIRYARECWIELRPAQAGPPGRRHSWLDGLWRRVVTALRRLGGAPQIRNK